MVVHLLSEFIEDHRVCMLYAMTGSVGGLPGRGRKRTVRTGATVEAVRQGVLEDPSAIVALLK